VCLTRSITTKENFEQTSATLPVGEIYAQTKTMAIAHPLKGDWMKAKATLVAVGISRIFSLPLLI